jgi:hypothetical protein
MTWKLGAALIVAAAVAGGLGGCGQSSSVENSAYQSDDGAVRIDFKSDDKAVVSLAGMPQDCTYSQKEKTISITCQGDKADFTLNDDGSLAGPPEGFAPRLTRVTS